ncbi:hypothetical protein GCK72_024358 [Caenorhabditis remanei]|nr:hypothetical protein GCK72_024358 [Caenorhabditis remanei]KAF1747892.1 hypothetical protein GCK72_024358 [Caenorhabditis remanei]
MSSQRMPEMTQQLKLSGGSKLFQDAVTVQINMKEATPDADDKVNKKYTANKHRFEASRHTASMLLEAEDMSAKEGDPGSKMEVKITINMKQLEKHHREIESYISPFTPSPNSIFLRIPPRPEDYARIELARDEVEKLVREVHLQTPHIITEEESREYLQILRKLDVRLSALYPRPPAPGDKEKKSYRMCPCYEPEMEDIEDLVVFYEQVFRGHRFMHRCNLYMAEKQAAEEQGLPIPLPPKIDEIRYSHGQC